VSAHHGAFDSLDAGGQFRAQQQAEAAPAKLGVVKAGASEK
jgi:hypothetical protein